MKINFDASAQAIKAVISMYFLLSYVYRFRTWQ